MSKNQDAIWLQDKPRDPLQSEIQGVYLDAMKGSVKLVTNQEVPEITAHELRGGVEDGELV